MARKKQEVEEAPSFSPEVRFRVKHFCFFE